MTTHTTPTATDAILSKIKKLQALADRAGTTAEAANAAARIQEMLFKHNLTLAQVDGHQGAEAYTGELFTLDGTTYHWAWHRRLAFDVARHNFCTAVQHSGTGRMTIIGQAHNVAVVRHLYTFLAREIFRLGLEAQRVAMPEKTSGFTRAAWVRTFALGACREIQMRLQAQRHADTAAAASAGTAMVHVTDAALKAALRRLFPNVGRAGRVSAGRNLEAFNQGRAAGRTITLSRGAMGGNGHRALGA